MIKKMIFSVLAISLLMSCDINKTKDGEMPDMDVDVDVDAGALPEFDVDWAEVNVGMTTKTVSVPKVVIVMEEVEVEVPVIDVDMPNGGEKEERTLLIEAEVSGEEHTIGIKEIWATGNNLYVISELKSTGTDIGDKKMRISDQVTLNASDLNVKHYVIGERPDRIFNTQHTYVKSMSDLENRVGEHKVIYSK